MRTVFGHFLSFFWGQGTGVGWGCGGKKGETMSNNSLCKEAGYRWGMSKCLRMSAAHLPGVGQQCSTEHSLQGRMGYIKEDF